MTISSSAEYQSSVPGRIKPSPTAVLEDNVLIDSVPRIQEAPGWEERGGE